MSGSTVLLLGVGEVSPLDGNDDGEGNHPVDPFVSSVGIFVVGVGEHEFDLLLNIFGDEGGKVVDLSGDFLDHEEDNVVFEESVDRDTISNNEDTSSEDTNLIEVFKKCGEMSYDEVVAVRVVRYGMSVDELLVLDGLNKLGYKEDTEDRLGDSSDTVSVVEISSFLEVSVVLSSFNQSVESD